MTHSKIVDHPVRCAVDSRDTLGEGAFWSVEDAAVYWLDVPMPSVIHRFTPATGRHESWPAPEIITAMARRADGTLLVASENGLNTFDPGTGGFEPIFELEPDRPDNRSNDGAPDAKGRFWIGTMQNNIGEGGTDIAIRGATGRLWRLEAGRQPAALIDGISITNGVAWSPDNRTLFVVDSMLDTIYAYPFDLEAGELGERRVFSDVAGHGTPDGGSIDAEGFLWSARWDGHAVIRFAPDGSIDRIVPIPASRVTSCAFGGPDLATLYVTTARWGIDPETAARYPQQGSLFAFEPGVSGLRRPLYAG